MRSRRPSSKTGRTTMEPLWTTRSRVARTPPGSITVSRRTSKTRPWKSVLLEIVFARAMVASGDYGNYHKGETRNSKLEKRRVTHEARNAYTGWRISSRRGKSLKKKQIPRRVAARDGKLFLFFNLVTSRNYGDQYVDHR